MSGSSRDIRLTLLSSIWNNFERHARSRAHHEISRGLCYNGCKNTSPSAQFCFFYTLTDGHPRALCNKLPACQPPLQSGLVCGVGSCHSISAPWEPGQIFFLTFNLKPSSQILTPVPGLASQSDWQWDCPFSGLQKAISKDHRTPTGFPSKILSLK